MIDVHKIRSDFPILETQVYGKPLVYLDNAATTHKPRGVLDGIMDFYTTVNSNIHRGVHYLSERASVAYEKARESVKDFVNAGSVSEIVFTSGTTEAINTVAGSFGSAFINAGDEIIVSEMEHHSNLVPWQLLCDRKKARIRIIPFDDDGLLRIDVLESLLSHKTKLVSMTYVSNALGVINPVKKIIDLVHAHDIPVLIDGAQAVQHTVVDVQDLDCDFFAFSGHKMYAETGIGVLYGKEKWLDAMPPYQSGGGMINAVSLEKTTFADLPLKFEAGTPNVAAAVSLKTAIDYIGEIGIGNIASHEQDVLNRLTEGLSALDGVTIYGAKTARHGALSFNLDGIDPSDAGMILDKMGIAVRTGTHCAEPVMAHYGVSGTIRASVGVYNTSDEIDGLIEGIKKVKAMLL
jgi:cysteine desulfurase/selenocysteine lyase